MELVGPPVEYTETPPVPSRKTHPWLSHYVVQTVEFINRFATVCEHKLMEMSQQLEKLETTMAFLEAKLNSIPGLQDAGAAGAVAAAPRQEEVILPAVGADIVGGDAPSYSFDDGASVLNLPAPTSAGFPAAPPAPPAAPAGPSAKNDPRFEKYFKMQRLGVPDAQIKQKMRTDGVDPSVLDNPDGPAPPASSNGNDSDEMFDDDEDDFSD